MTGIQFSARMRYDRATCSKQAYLVPASLLGKKPLVKSRTVAIQREYLSPNEIAEYLGVSPFTIRRYIKLGELRAVKLLGGFRVHRDDLQRFLKAHEVNPSEEELEPEEAPEVTSPAAVPLPTHAAPAPVPLPPVPFPSAASEPAPGGSAGKKTGKRKQAQTKRPRKKSTDRPSK